MFDHSHPSVWKLLSAADAADHARADQDARWRVGKPLPVEKYLEALPKVAADPELAMVLIYGEVLSRTEAGQTPTADEYRRRFPRLADRLAVQFQLHSALGKASAGDTDPDGTRPADDTRPLVPAGERALPEVYGPYTAGEVIGRGGMGVVLAAHDPALDREVAIKTLRPGHPRSAEAAVRFARESRISAKVQHPGVPAVYAAGELADGTPYLAMKLIRGRTLADLFRARPDPSADRPRLLRVFEQVCQAVGFAHSERVVHRDLKPANVMVGAHGEVQVMDWGLAKELAAVDLAPDADSPDDDRPADATRKGTVLGTPAYMPPEQARGEDADERADVFALGGILAELLTGQPPFVGGGAAAVAQSATADLSAVTERLAGCGADDELVALAGRCLAPDPADRPANGSAVAEAMAKYHADADARLRQAERAKAAAEAQAVEQRKRRRVQVALAVAVAAVLLVGGVGVWVVQKQNADRELEATKVDAERAEQRRRAADGVDRGIAQAVELRNRMLWAQADAALAQATAAAGSDPDPEWTVKLDAAKSELDLLRKLDAARLNRVFWQGKKGMKATTDAEYAALFKRHGYDVFTPTPEEAAERINASPIRDELLTALDDWTFGAAEKGTADRVLAVAKGVAGKSWRDVLNKKFPEGEKPPDARDWLATIPPADRGPVLYMALSNKAKKDGGSTVAVMKEGVEQFPTDFWLAVYLAMAHEEWNELGLALSTFRTARALRPDSWHVPNEMGVVCLKMGDRAAAIRLFRESLALQPSAPTYSNLGNALQQDKKLAEAVAAHKLAVRLDPEYANAWNNLGTALRDDNQIDEAIAAFRKAIELAPEDAAPRFSLGLALLTAKKDAKAALAEFQKIFDDKLEMADDERVKLFVAMSHACKMLNRLADAEAHLRAAVKLNKEHAESHYQLADVLCLRGKPKAAIPEYREAIRLDDKQAKYHTDLGVELRMQDDLDGAIKCHREAVRLDPTFVEAHVNLGSAYLHQQEYAKAEKCFRDAVRLDERLAAGHYNLGLALARQKKYADADASFRAALKHNKALAPQVNPLLAALEKERKSAREVLPPPRPADDGK